MSDPTPATSTPPVPRKRLIWPWVLGGGLLFFFLLTAVIVGVIVASGAAQRAAQAQQREHVEQVVLDFDQAYEDADCDAFEAITTEELRDDIQASSYDCDEWQDAAKDLTVDGDYTYRVKVLSSEVDGDTATVRTRERVDADSTPAEYVYELERDGGDWVIVQYDED